uniref:Uncharacterized protein n=1 Tax=Brugia malayi TaxID=6279 RepID=A8Q3M6_BRUMA
MLFISMNILCTVEDSSIFAWVNDSMSIIDDARMQKMNGLRQTINSKYYQKLLNLMCMQHSSFSMYLLASTI